VFLYGPVLYGWSGRLEQSPTAHSFCTYMINFQKHAQDIFSHVPASLTNCFQSMSSNTVRCPCSDSSHVTVPVLFPEQTLGSGSDVSQTLIQKYGTVCRLHSDSPGLSFAVFKQHLKSYLFNAI